MTPATMTADEQQQTVEEHRERLEEIRAALEEARERKQKLDERIGEAELERDTERADELREERREAAELVSDLEGVVPAARQRVEEAEYKALRSAAQERVQSAKKKAGGLHGDRDRRIEQAREAQEKYREAVEALADIYPRQRALKAEITVLCREFGLEVPELKMVPPTPADDALLELTDFNPGAVRREADSKRQYASGIENKWSQGKRSSALQEVRELTEDSPTPELLERLEEETEDE